MLSLAPRAKHSQRYEQHFGSKPNSGFARVSVFSMT